MLLRALQRNRRSRQLRASVKIGMLLGTLRMHVHGLCLEDYGIPVYRGLYRGQFETTCFGSRPRFLDRLMRQRGLWFRACLTTFVQGKLDENSSYLLGC